MAARGCGTRVAGGIYFEVATSPFGKPIDHFLYDPPVELPEGLELPARGQVVLPRPDDSGVYDVYDRIGSEHYPNVQDVIEETRHMGLSRRAAKTTDFALLGRGSMIILAHARAIIENPVPYYDVIGAELPVGGRMWWCPKHIAEHATFKLYPHMCAGLWRHDIEGGIATDAGSVIERIVGSTSYFAYARPEGVNSRAHIGLFAGLPLGGITVIRDDDGMHHGALDKALLSRLPVSVEDE